MDPYESQQQTGYDSTGLGTIHRPKWTAAQLAEGWFATGFLAATFIPIVILLQCMTVGTSLAVWWSVTLPSIGLVAIVAYLAARCLHQRPIRYRLRTLMIVLALGPPVLAVTWWVGLFIVEFAPRPRSYAETFTCFLVFGLLLFAVGGVVVQRMARRQPQ